MARLCRCAAEGSRLLAHCGNLLHTQELSDGVGQDGLRGQEDGQGGRSAEDGDEDDAEDDRSGGVGDVSR